MIALSSTILDAEHRYVNIFANFFLKSFLPLMQRGQSTGGVWNFLQIDKLTKMISVLSCGGLFGFLLPSVHMHENNIT